MATDDEPPSPKWGERSKNESRIARTQSQWRELSRSHGTFCARPQAEIKATNRCGRLRTKFFAKSKEDEPSNQYRIPPRTTKKSYYLSVLFENKLLAHIRFMTLKSMSQLIIFFLLWFFVFIVLFALLLQVFVKRYYEKGHECVSGYDYDSVGLQHNYYIIFELSWTTFSSVGYGVIGLETDTGCQALRYFLAFESFFGAVNSGLCGAVFFANISRLLARAYVTFASSICLQFDKGVSDPHLSVSKEVSAPKPIGDKDESAITGPFPFIEMRLLNDETHMDGAIFGASLLCVAVSSKELDGVDILFGRNARYHKESTEVQINTGEDSSQAAKIRVPDEMDITPSTIPYFSKGAWYFRHVLNEHSPLLKASVRERIQEIGGWPSDLNEHSHIRACLSESLEGVVVMLTGTSNMTGDVIFKTERYSMGEIRIGWRFADLGYFSDRDAYDGGDSGIIYDRTLIHDIRPQRGGGNEPLTSGTPQGHATDETPLTSYVAMFEQQYLSRIARRENYDRFLRPAKETRAMKYSQRLFTKLSRRTRSLCGKKEEQQKERDSCQYSIPPVEQSKHFVASWIASIDQGLCVGTTLWLYKTSFLIAILVLLLGYFVFIWLFALLIRASDVSCLSGWEYAYDNSFVGSFYIPLEASWTTFSTVGYGAVAPIPGRGCSGVSFLLATEAFIGILYVSYCGAIFYAKITREENTADVSFSSALCLQYDTGVAKAEPDETVDSIPMPQSSEKTDESDASVVSFPFIEMQLINDKSHLPRSEILKASIKCITESFQLKDTANDTSVDFDSNDESTLLHQSHDAGYHLAWKRTYDEIKVTPKSRHVFPLGPWTLRHVLDDSSPWLKSSVRTMIKERGGWPKELNDHQKIRSSLSTNVRGMYVFFGGISNLTAGDVFKIHEYKPEDMFVGWTFAGMGYVEEAKHGDEIKRVVKFDRALQNDIVPQKGGNAEPLSSGDADEPE